MGFTLCITISGSKQRGSCGITYYSEPWLAFIAICYIIPDLDSNIPDFQIDKNGISEKRTDDNAYESMNTTGNIVLQATPAYHFEPVTGNQHKNQNNHSAHMDDRGYKSINVTGKIVLQTILHFILNPSQRIKILIKAVITKWLILESNNALQRTRKPY